MISTPRWLKNPKLLLRNSMLITNLLWLISPNMEKPKSLPSLLNSLMPNRSMTSKKTGTRKLLLLLTRSTTSSNKITTLTLRLLLLLPPDSRKLLPLLRRL